jgi:large subunit ribosomal protein L19
MDVSNLLDAKPTAEIDEFGPGDTVRVSAKVVEGDRERSQVFEGVVIRRNTGGAGANFTVRRMAHGVGVERTFNINSPRLEKVKVVREGRVRRARLYYLRGRTGKAARIKEKARPTA